MDYQQKESGFFDLPKLPTKCNDSEHAFPSYLHIPVGQGYRHVCPTCGAVQIARNSSVLISYE